MLVNPYGLNPNGPTLHGIDVASPQGHEFDWQHAATENNVRFAWMQVDNTFARNWRLSRQAGIKRGPYGFFRADQDPIIQANTLLKKIVGDYHADDLHPMIDVEVLRGVSPAQVLDGAAKWIEHIRKELGRPVVWYTYPSFCVNKPTDDPPGLGGLTAPIMGECLLWVAHYIVSPATGVPYKLAKPIVPKPWKEWALWQTSGNKGPIGHVDCNVFWGTEDAFRQLFTNRVSEPPDTVPESPTGKSTPRMQAVKEPVGTYDKPPGIVVPEGEHSIDIETGDEDL